MRTHFKLGFLILFLVLGFILCSLQLPPKCGEWRWDIKTLTDPQGVGLLTKQPIKSSIDELVVPKPPKVLYADNYSDGQEPRMSSETQVVEIIAYVTKVKHESDDSDLHLILKSPNSENTMIGEIPDPACSTFDRFPLLRTYFTKTRQDVYRVWDFWKNAKHPIKVKVTGITFWDGIHAQNNPKGASQYCREIHPILSIEIQ
jgi:hypothetical protein